MSLFEGVIRRMTAGQQKKTRNMPELSISTGGTASQKVSGQWKEWTAPVQDPPEPEIGADILSQELERESRRYDRGIT